MPLEYQNMRFPARCFANKPFLQRDLCNIIYFENAIITVASGCADETS